MRGRNVRGIGVIGGISRSMQPIIQPAIGADRFKHVTPQPPDVRPPISPTPDDNVACRDNHPDEPQPVKSPSTLPVPDMKLLALDTSTEQLSIAVQSGDRVWCHRGAGGAQASASLIPGVLELLAQASLRLSELDALVVGRGPGSFTGLRTACAVVQGLAYGATRPVLGLDTLLALAPPVRAQDPGARRVLAVLDARMQQVYAAAYEFREMADNRCGEWHTVMPPGLYDPGDLTLPAAWQHDPAVWLAGNAFALLDPAPGVLRSPEGLARCTLACLPDAQALLQLAPTALARGEATAAQDLLPLYLRDKVALTTAERHALKTPPVSFVPAPTPTPPQATAP
ncbi:MAG: hypothetical protein RJA69_1115 [Pseudomonadota bacterium]